MNNKKGAEMTIGTIIIIILALVVLVVLIFGFSTGWGNLWEKIVGYTGGDVNVETHVSACELACATSQDFEYCKDRSIVFEAGKDAETIHCKTLEGKGVGLDACTGITCTVAPPEAPEAPAE
ncbi:hypothetical protein HOD75_02435 [archaeon]|jgi:hypothetical protein|nr:hypothetical protein [archaeon]MBT4241736.1 hypothetical protein [archaeon]MBT4418284.1 hypothetical protein [archaeon]